MVLGRQDYHWQHEPCLYGWKDGAAHYFVDDRTQVTVYEDRPDIKNMKKQDLQEMLENILDGGGFSTIIREDKPAASELHPTMKPIKLIARLVRNSSRKGECVLDVFGGSGSTMIACEQLGRINRTVELDPRYCDVIVDRWEKLTGKKAELLTDE
jgi:site-specific DNA-methyltransferase (adenine-specific)